MSFNLLENLQILILFQTMLIFKIISYFHDKTRLIMMIFFQLTPRLRQLVIFFLSNPSHSDYFFNRYSTYNIR